MSGIKMLPLEKWMTFDPTIGGTNKPMYTLDTEVSPDGWYYNRLTRFCWYQFQGISYQDDPKSFLYNMALLNHKPLTRKEKTAFQILKLERKLSKSQVKMLRLDDEWNMIRETYRMTIKSFLKYSFTKDK